jgi:putative hydrolase of the HAD superfamily
MFTGVTAALRGNRHAPRPPRLCLSKIEGMPRPLTNQTLLVDADDTLWENGIYFDRAVAAFISFLDHEAHTPEQVRVHLNRIDHATIQAHGYGAKSFRRALLTCFEELSGASASGEQQEQIAAFAQAIADHEIELLPEVAETLARLAERHRLILVTKGNVEEQTTKLARSGLACHFSAVEVPHEKHAQTYRALAERYALRPHATWMIGNSPISDIQAPLAAGLNAVWIPHEFTQFFEHATVDDAPPGQILLQLERFAQLLDYF